MTTLSAPAKEFRTVREQSLFLFFWMRFRRHVTAMLGGIIMLIMTIVIAFAPVFSPYDPFDQDLLNRLQPPSAEHWMGTDDLGRDMLTRILYGGRISLPRAHLAAPMPACSSCTSCPTS